MGKQKISRQLYDLVNTPNDRAFNLVTIFVMRLFIASEGTALGLSSDDIDNLFITASGL